MGSVDECGRPVVRMRSTGDDLLIVVDTGFDGALLATRTAAKALGINPLGRTSSIELGDGSVSEVYEAIAALSWLEERRSVRVLVADTWEPPAEAPQGLLGTELLSPHLLLIGFSSRTVEIETRHWHPAF